jgi:hypothetical protein
MTKITSGSYRPRLQPRYWTKALEALPEEEREWLQVLIGLGHHWASEPERLHGRAATFRRERQAATFRRERQVRDGWPRLPESRSAAGWLADRPSPSPKTASDPVRPTATAAGLSRRMRTVSRYGPSPKNRWAFPGSRTSTRTAVLAMTSRRTTALPTRRWHR